jgi:hypothetical protein
MLAKFAKHAVAAAFALVSASAFSAATIVIVNGNAAGVGFNDPTPAVPVGGNPGTTLGQQRLNAFQYAANVWGAELDSAVTIEVLATFEPLACTATSATLGSAGPFNAWSFNSGAPALRTWYHAALANKIAGVDIDTIVFGENEPEISARFNSNLGAPGCLTGGGWYYGIDGNKGALTDLVAVLLHEFAHGLGFSTLTSSATGIRFPSSSPADQRPSRYDNFLFDNQQGLAWDAMTNAQRAASAITPRKVAWTGANVFAAAPSVLSLGFPEVAVSGPQAGAAAGTIEIGVAQFGPTFASPGVTGQIMPVVDQAAGTGLACTALSAVNRAAVRGNIALVDRGTCSFDVKVKNAQDAGAIAVLVADNAAGGPPPGLGVGSPAIAATVTIPSGRISLEDATRLKAALVTRSRTTSGVVATLGVNASRRAGTDSAGRPLMYTPNPRIAGSSVSHWDTSASRNLLMEPNISGDLTQSVKPPQDLTLPMFKDLGW